MSSNSDRDPLDGLIRHNEKVVGSVCLPEEDQQEFIEEFNHCYGPLSMHIEAPVLIPQRHKKMLPVGARQPKSLELPRPVNQQGPNNQTGHGDYPE